MRSHEVESDSSAAVESRPERAAGSERGFTLFETAIAIGVMTIVALGSITVFTYATGYNMGGNTRAMAIALAQQQMEQLRSVPFNDSSLTATGTSGAQATATMEGQSFTVLTTISDDSTTQLKTITIQVTPIGGNNALTSSSVSVTLQRAPNTAGSYYQ